MPMLNEVQTSAKITRRQIVEYARSFRGTPFKHQGRRPGIGLDCAGVVIRVGADLGIAPGFDFTGYSHFPRPTLVSEQLRGHLDRIAGGASLARAGDVAYVADGGYAVHMGIIGEHEGYLTLIHASRRDGGVIEHRIDRKMFSDIRGVFRFRGVD